MTTIEADPRLTWEPPFKRRLEPGEDHFVNDMERDFAAFLDVNGIVWLYEPHFFFLNGSKLKRGYCPDFYLPGYDIYIEIYWGCLSEGRRKKRQRIRLLSKYSAKGTVIMHTGNWSAENADWAEVERLINRARIAALIQRTQQILDPEVSEWEC